MGATFSSKCHPNRKTHPRGIKRSGGRGGGATPDGTRCSDSTSSAPNANHLPPPISNQPTFTPKRRTLAPPSQQTPLFIGRTLQSRLEEVLIENSLPDIRMCLEGAAVPEPETAALCHSKEAAVLLLLAVLILKRCWTPFCHHLPSQCSHPRLTCAVRPTWSPFSFGVSLTLVWPSIGCATEQALYPSTLPLTAGA